MINAAENTLVIFGAMDHESIAAKKLAEKYGYAITDALFDGIAVNARNAYLANGMIFNPEWHDFDNVIFFECSKGSAVALNYAYEAYICDHHNPGDPGYDSGPDFFWLGSSLGQLCSYIDVPATEHLLYTAAADHCPKDAYAGLCPGIDPAKFGEFRIDQKVSAEYGKIEGLAVKEYEKQNEIDGLYEYIDYMKEQYRPLDVIKSNIDRALLILEQANDNQHQIGRLISGVVDLCELGMIKELSEAAMRGGYAYTTKIDETDRDRKPTGNKKILLGGNATPKQVEEFMVWGNSLPDKIGNAYGNPTRGYAGVVIN